MAAKRSRTLTARELKPRIQRLSWERLTGIHLASRSQPVRRMIEGEARGRRYKMNGFTLAQAVPWQT